MVRHRIREAYSVGSGAQGRRVVSFFALGIALAMGATACRTSEEDVHRWGESVQGPKKLYAVLTHTKYGLDLRVEAAMTLVEMKPRRGKRVGIQGDDDNKGLVDALAELTPADRQEIITRMVPQLVANMQKAPPKAQAGQPSPPDPSFPFKDAAFAILTQNDGALIVSEDSRRKLRAALSEWCMVNFAERVDESSQMFGTEQILKFLQAEGVRKLPDLMVPDARKVDLMARLVSEQGDRDTKLSASRRLVAIAEDMNSSKWIQRKAPDVERANKISKYNPSKKVFDAQLVQYQEEELLRAFVSMKQVGGKPVVDYLLRFAEDKQQSEKRRAAALAALEGNINKDDKDQVQAVLRIARAEDTPDEIRDQALRRVGEMPRALVVEDLYALFTHKKWKIRWMAAELILKMSDPSHVAEFMERLRKVEGMALTEVYRYGTLIGQMKGTPAPAELVAKYAAPGNPVQARLTALGYYFENGSKQDLPKITQYEGDTAKTPECGADAAGCEWKCTVDENKQPQVKEVKTLGEFVKYCVVPALEQRQDAGKKAEPQPKK
jgi:hypothetical protein